MATLTVQNQTGDNASLTFTDHSPNRTATLTSVVGAALAPGDVITFGTSGAVGAVVSLVSTLLTFVLTTCATVKVEGEDYLLLPWDGETITASGGKSAVVTAMTQGGDSFENDDLRPQLIAVSQTGSDAYLVAQAQKRTRFGPALSRFFPVPGGGTIATQAFDRERFNRASGLGVLVTYVGTAIAADLQVAAVATVPR